MKSHQANLKKQVSSSKVKPIFISQGDLCGVAWQALKEIISTPKKYLNKSELKSLHRLVIVGELPTEELNFWNKQVNLYSINKKKKDYDLFASFLAGKLKNTKPTFLVSKQRKTFKAGEPNLSIARASYTSFIEAASLWQATEGASLVTLPVSKEFIIKSGIDFAGHTEVLAKLYNRKTILCMYHPKLAVPLLTNHLPLKKVPSAILKLKAQDLAPGLLQLQKLFRYNKPMALLGLNPHAGEGGKIGDEEKELRMLTRDLQKLGLNIEGPLPADGFFSPNVRTGYSAGLACYHDQGLVAFKALFGLEGLNITLNLPKLRVSPDHGPAYSLAKNNQGDIKSVLYSIRFAIKWGHLWTQESSSLF